MYVSNFTSFQLAAIFLTVVLVEGRMVTRRGEQRDEVVVGQAGVDTNKRVVRQAEEAGPFDLFGQVLNSFGEKETCERESEKCEN